MHLKVNERNNEMDQWMIYSKVEGIFYLIRFARNITAVKVE